MFLKYLLIFNIILIGIMAIFEISNFKKFLFWAFIIFIFSFLGYIAYIVLGNALKFSAKSKIENKRKSTKNYLKTAQIKYENTHFYNDLAKYAINTSKCILWNKNILKVFTNGNVFFDDLLQEIKHAKNHIHLEFYIFSDDKTGQTLAKLLIEKAKQGVEIKIIYDAFGSKKTKKKFWKNLEKHNIKTSPFFPPMFNLNLLNFKINYRNHRKIVIIDGKIAYTGGINIRNDHMGKSKKLSPWRDTQLKIFGTGVYSLQDIFLNDWHFCNKSKSNKSDIKKYFPIIQNKGKYNLQIIDDGPDYDTQRILSTYLKIINSSKKFLYIQTPYFIINNELLNSIINAFNRNVDICIFLPQKPDKNLVYTASLLNIQKLFNLGIKIFLYPGFIHSKVLVTEEVVCIGSCNFDYRSFYLNFETTCLSYNHSFIEKNLNIIKKDMEHSTFLTKKHYKKIKNKNFLSIILYKLISKFL